MPQDDNSDLETILEPVHVLSDLISDLQNEAWQDGDDKYADQ